MHEYISEYIMRILRRARARLKPDPWSAILPLLLRRRRRHRRRLGSSLLSPGYTGRIEFNGERRQTVPRRFYADPDAGISNLCR